MSGWNLTDDIKNKFGPTIEEYLNKVQRITSEQVCDMTNEELGLDLSDIGISPYQLLKLLKEFGYEERSRDDNGWELDFWISLRKVDGQTFESSCENLVICGCGMTFELRLYIDGFDF